MTERRQLALSLARWVAALALLAAVLGTVWVGLRARSAGIDYYQFWIVGRARAALDLRDAYSDQGRARMAELGRRLARTTAQATGRLEFCAYYRETVESFATPFLYALVSAASTGDYDTDLRRFQAASIAAFVAALAALCALLGRSAAAGVAAAALLCALSDPLGSDVRTANVGELQVGGLALVLALRRREGAGLAFAAGAVLAALVALKPTLALAPALLALALLAERRLRPLLELAGGALAGGLAAFAVGAHFLGARAWLDWLGVLGGLERVSDISIARGNFSLAQWVSERGGPGLGLFLTAGLALAAGAALWLGSFESRFQREYLAIALGGAIAVLGPELVWLHYYVLLVPLLLFPLRPGAGAWQAAGALACALALLGLPLRALTRVENPEIAALVYVFAAWCAVLVAVAPRVSLTRSASVR
ncbi:MAG TPA: glycosyltransferase 87 family protein [Myxococcota bacterium]|nr:glycosyltransferase 87 family protein [Myxococcota bacterium]